jgi:hypothetical protein
MSTPPSGAWAKSVSIGGWVVEFHGPLVKFTRGDYEISRDYGNLHTAQVIAGRLENGDIPYFRHILRSAQIEFLPKLPIDEKKPRKAKK